MSNEPTTGVETKEQIGLAYQAFMLLLCVYAILNVIAGALFPLTENAKQILQYADAAVCAVFFIDFLANLWRAPDKWRYMRTWGWIDLLSSVPAINFLRIGRIARLLRISEGTARTQGDPHPGRCLGFPPHRLGVLRRGDCHLHDDRAVQPGGAQL